MQKLVYYLNIVQQKIKTMSYLEDFQVMIVKFDFSVIIPNKNMVYKDYKVLKHEINFI
jgi:hypothetical protein